MIKEEEIDGIEICFVVENEKRKKEWITEHYIMVKAGSVGLGLECLMGVLVSVGFNLRGHRVARAGLKETR